MIVVRKRVLIVLAAGLLMLAGVGTSSAEIYKWVDAKGNVHFQDHPPASEGKVADVEVRASSPVRPADITTAPAAGAAQAAVAEPAVEPMSAKSVELYTVSWCPWCKKARDYFVAQGVSLTEYDIEKDKAALARKNELDPEKGVPFAVVNGKKIHGFSVDAYAKALSSPSPGSLVR